MIKFFDDLIDNIKDGDDDPPDIVTTNMATSAAAITLFTVMGEKLGPAFEQDEDQGKQVRNSAPFLKRMKTRESR
jgi:hypothetical protein